jgi:hypothetical protein
MVSHALLLRHLGLHSGTLPACKVIQFIAADIVPQKKFPGSALFFDEFLEQCGTA